MAERLFTLTPQFIDLLAKRPQGIDDQMPTDGLTKDEIANFVKHTTDNHVVYFDDSDQVPSIDDMDTTLYLACVDGEYIPIATLEEEEQS